jgi:hypothetical protein
MKYFLVLFICYNSFSQTITGKYEFKFRENRVEKGWDKVDTPGEVIFYEDENINTVTIITLTRVELLYVISRRLFTRKGSFLYTLIDDNFKECYFRIETVNTLNTLELYYYSNRAKERYYRLILKKSN